MAESPALHKDTVATTSKSTVDIGTQADIVSLKTHLLLEEATSLATAPPHVRDLVKSLGPNPDPKKLTTALAVVVLVQSGFRLTKNDATSSTRTFDARVMRRLRSFSPAWVKRGRPTRYMLPLWLSGRPDAQCRLVGFLRRKTFHLKIWVLRDTTFSTVLEPMSVHGPWDNLPQICERTYQLAAEVRTHLLEDSMVVYPALTGIPPELILNIFSYLDANDLRALSCLCRSFNEIASDNVLWKRLLHLRFPLSRVPEDGDFKKAYTKEEEQERIERNRVRLRNLGYLPSFSSAGCPLLQFRPRRSMSPLLTRSFLHKCM